MPNSRKRTKSAPEWQDVGRENPKEAARKQTGNGICRIESGRRVEQHGNQHQALRESGEERCCTSCRRRYAAGENVGGNDHAHGNPQSGPYVVVGAPGAALAGDGQGLGDIERLLSMVSAEKQLVARPRRFRGRRRVRVISRRIPGGEFRDRNCQVVANFLNLVEISSGGGRAIRPCADGLAEILPRGSQKEK